MKKGFNLGLRQRESQRVRYRGDRGSEIEGQRSRVGNRGSEIEGRMTGFRVVI